VETGQAEGEPLRVPKAKYLTVAFSPDGKTLVSEVAINNTVHFWDIQSREPISDFLGQFQGNIESVAFSPDGSTLVLGLSDDTVQFWDIERRRISGSIPRIGMSSANTLAYSPDGKMLAWSDGAGLIGCWDLELNQRVFYDPVGTRGSAYLKGFSHDGKRLLSDGGTSGKIVQWDADGEFAKRTFRRGFDDTFKAAAFSPDDKILALAGYTRPIHLIDVATERAIGGPLRAT
jgi:WD40 repeat protein